VLILPHWFMHPLQLPPIQAVAGCSQPGHPPQDSKAHAPVSMAAATQPFCGLFLENGIASACGDSQKLIAGKLQFIHMEYAQWRSMDTVASRPLHAEAKEAKLGATCYLARWINKPFSWRKHHP